jgi:hypothetical protein
MNTRPSWPTCSPPPGASGSDAIRRPTGWPTPPQPSTSTSRGRRPTAAAAHLADHAAQTTSDELTRLRRRVRRRLADIVAAGHLDIDRANGMLQAFGLPGLRRAYTVRIRVPFIVRVSADCGADAYQAARDTLAEALVPDGDEIEVVWDNVENDGAEPGDIDIDEPDPT